MLGKNLKELRIKKGVTQDDMAELLNIKRQTYSAYERGVSLPDVTSLLKMAEFFCVSVDEILDYIFLISVTVCCIYLLMHRNVTAQQLDNILDISTNSLHYQLWG